MPAVGEVVLDDKNAKGEIVTGAECMGKVPSMIKAS